jgi:2-C-methyl-D-erythritol 4-phosphate cytidylyltransferase
VTLKLGIADNIMKVSVVIPAAGLGTRMGGIKKPYMDIAGKPILAYTLGAFQRCPFIDSIVIVTAKGDESRCIQDIKTYGIDKPFSIVAGGDTRQESVFNALRELSSNTDIVVIHDAVRPLLTENMIIQSIDNANLYGSAIVAVPVKDTIKESDDDGFVAKTLNRRKLWAIQTPQTFKYDLIMKAHLYARNNNIQATDDAFLVEQIGHKVKLIMGSYENIKITTPDDLAIAKAILESRL